MSNQQTIPLGIKLEDIVKVSRSDSIAGMPKLKRRKLDIGLVGNANVGKTSLVHSFAFGESTS